MTTNTATERQVDFFVRLATEFFALNGVEVSSEQVDNLKANVAQLSRAEISRKIDEQLQANKAKAAEVQAVEATKIKTLLPGVPASAGRVVVNRYGGRCCSCGTQVAVGAGHAFQIHNWSIICSPCASTSPAERSAKAQAADAERKAFEAAVKALAERVGATRDGKVRFVLPGEAVAIDNSEAAYQLNLVSPYIERHVGGVGRVVAHKVGAAKGTEIVNLLLALGSAALVEAQAAYGRHFHHCGRCGSPLSDDGSKARGLGPECARKGGF